jgi:structural maintenance of chromosome 2
MQKEVEAQEARIQDAKSQLESAQHKQNEAEEEVKKLQKDMAEFSNNKEGKIEELRVRLTISITFFSLNHCSLEYNYQTAK